MSQIATKSQVAEVTWGLAAEFAGPESLKKAAKKVRLAGYKKFDVQTPFPVHGMDDAMGLGRSHLGWLVLICGISGAAFALWMQWYVNVFDYPLITQGKPYFSWQAFLVVMFELMVLFSAFGAVVGMIAINGLPQWYHPTLKSDALARVTDDKFFLIIEAVDGKFDQTATAEFLRSIGARSITVLTD